MKWLDRWFKKKVAEALCEEKEISDSKYYRGNASIGIGTARANSIDTDKAIRFTVSKAQGGIVVETNFYDRISDRSFSGLYVFTDEQDLGKELNKIITLETLKQ